MTAEITDESWLVQYTNSFRLWNAVLGGAEVDEHAGELLATLRQYVGRDALLGHMCPRLYPNASEALEPYAEMVGLLEPIDDIETAITRLLNLSLQLEDHDYGDLEGRAELLVVIAALTAEAHGVGNERWEIFRSVEGEVMKYLEEATRLSPTNFNARLFTYMATNASPRGA